MIGISDCPISKHYASICIPSWESLGYKINWFEASTPETLRKEYGDVRKGELSFDKIFSTGSPSGREFSDTEIAVWYSHYRLWQHCVEIDSPIYIIEHDTYLLRKVPDFSGLRVCHFGEFSRTPQNEMPGVIAAAGSYYITPDYARILLNPSSVGGVHRNTTYARVPGSLKINVDGYLALAHTYEYMHRNNLYTNYRVTHDHDRERWSQYISRDVDLFINSNTCCIQIYEKSIGRTIEHLNPEES